MADSRQKWDWRIPAAVALALALMAGAIFPVFWAFQVQKQFREFSSDLSKSTTYAYQNRSLKTVGEGGTLQPLPGEYGYRIYNTVLTTGQGKLQKKLPQEDADLELRYGDGSSLRAWGVQVKNSRRNTDDGVLFCYIDQEGKAYIYDTDMLTIGRLQQACRP